MNIFIDIETFAGNTKPDIGEIEAPSNYKDEAKIKAYKEDALDKEYRKQALNSMLGQIVCIGVAINDEEVGTFTSTDEKNLMFEFVEFLDNTIEPKDLCGAKFIAHNGLSFDAPWLWHRIKKYKLQDVLPHPDEKRWIDTMKLAGYTDYKSMYSLKKLATFFSIGDKDKSGADVHDLFLAGKLDEIADYCKNDVELLRNLYKILK